MQLIQEENTHSTMKDPKKPYLTKTEQRTRNGIMLLATLELARVYYDAQVAEEQEMIINKLKYLKEYHKDRKMRRQASKDIEKAKREFKKKSDRYDKFFEKFIDDFASTSEQHEQVIEIAKDSFEDYLSRLLKVRGTTVLIEQCQNKFLKLVDDYASDLDLDKEQVEHDIESGKLKSIVIDGEERVMF